VYYIKSNFKLDRRLPEHDASPHRRRPILINNAMQNLKSHSFRASYKPTKWSDSWTTTPLKKT